MDETTDRPNKSSHASEGMSCEQFQGQMAELMGGDIYSHEHLKTCRRCSALLQELQDIADAARIFMHGEDYEPPDELWRKIKSKMGSDDTSQNGNFPHP
jgi:hypothetical protein